MILRTQSTFLLALFTTVLSTKADVHLAPIFQDHMVLQRERAVPIWGTGVAGESVTLTLADQSRSATVDADGRWRVTLSPLQAGGPWTLEVKGANALKLNDVLIGDVWICSGQSNMEMQVASANDAPNEIAHANFPKIRLLHVPTHPTSQPSTELNAKWEICSPQTVPTFSAAGYFFGRELFKRLTVPMGLIESSVGGTPSESWTSYEVLEADPAAKPITDRWAAEKVTYPKRKAEYDAAMKTWESKYRVEPDNLGERSNWQGEAFDDSKWGTMKEPTFWQRAGVKSNGTVWFRKIIDVPADRAGQDLTLSLGRLDDCDMTYFNGQLVGKTWRDNPYAVFVVRTYTIPGKLVKAGKNLIAIRILDQGGEGGFAADPGVMKAASATEPGPAISLDGDWKYQVESTMAIPQPPGAPRGPDNAWTPATLYNGMIYPLIPFAMRGVIWYQGESNADRAEQYQTIFPLMITSWRKAWGGAGDDPFPFYFVQLANFGLWRAEPAQPADSTWAELREAQAMTLRLPNTGMATAADIGDTADIHPKNKQEVGRRLALEALAGAYGKQEVPHAGPFLQSSTIDGKRLRLKFRPGAETLQQHGESLTGFAIAGEDHVFHWATATIDANDEVLVSAAEVPKPVAVRYGWSDNPKLSLYNSANLPAPPFRTDSWPLTTAGEAVDLSAQAFKEAGHWRTKADILKMLVACGGWVAGRCEGNARFRAIMRDGLGRMVIGLMAAGKNVRLCAILSDGLGRRPLGRVVKERMGVRGRTLGAAEDYGLPAGVCQVKS